MELVAMKPYTFSMSEDVLSRFSSYIESNFGIKMPPSKRSLLEGRLSRRIRALSLDSFDEYYEYLMGEGMNDEYIHFSDLVSTHKTDFFRERKHFDYLTASGLPVLTASGAGTSRPLTLWSAGCSSGEEPYTIAMTVAEYERTSRSIDYSILGTDVSAHTLAKGIRGVYHGRLIDPIPPALRERYLLRGRGDKEDLVRVVPELRAHIRFKVLNFMDDVYDVPGPFDVIFFRNVLIYFEKETQKRIIDKLASLLSDIGYLFIGHSESIFGMHGSLIPVAPTVYRKG
ncbi:MAG: protein-glutamate O-methyltransferase [Spirochaetota bacterium]